MFTICCEFLLLIKIAYLGDLLDLHHLFLARGQIPGSCASLVVMVVGEATTLLAEGDRLRALDCLEASAWSYGVERVLPRIETGVNSRGRIRRLLLKLLLHLKAVHLLQITLILLLAFPFLVLLIII